MSEWLTTFEAAELLGISPSTLRSMRRKARGNGPRYSRFSHRVVRYSREDVLSWLASRPQGGEGTET